MNFSTWKRKVSNGVEGMVGMGCDDLPDCMYWDEWDAGTTVEDMAEIVLVGACDSIGMNPDLLFAEL